MVRAERFELPTPCFVGKCTIQLSYGRTIDSKDLRPVRLLKRVQTRTSHIRHGTSTTLEAASRFAGMTAWVYMSIVVWILAWRNSSI